MLFLKLSPKQVTTYSHVCLSLQRTLNTIADARTTLEQVAQSTFDKSFAKCIYLLISESLQCENEIHAQIDSLSCAQLNVTSTKRNTKASGLFSVKNVESICSYLEEKYIKSYKKLLKDKYLSISLKNLINHHLQLFSSSLTQLYLFYEVAPLAN